MGQYKIDSHPDREEILTDIARGVPDQQIADKYGMARLTVLRYRNAPKNKMAQLRAVEEVYRETVTSLANKLVEKAQKLDKVHEALEAKILDEDGNLAVGDYREIHDALRLYVQTQETFGKHLIRLEHLGFGIAQSHNRATMEEETDTLIDVILKALEPYPKARQAVVAAVKRSRDLPK